MLKQFCDKCKSDIDVSTFDFQITQRFLEKSNRYLLEVHYDYCKVCAKEINTVIKPIFGNDLTDLHS